MRFSPYAVCFVAAFLVEKGLLAQATIEGKVELPQPSAEQLTNQRYQNSAEAVTGPPDPPMAVVYLEGNFANVASPPARRKWRKRISTSIPDLVADSGGDDGYVSKSRRHVSQRFFVFENEAV